ncbi:HAD family hydrolase [Mesorhizobium waimense]|uniref:HAD family hydrolase n=1 Tax=Mesorhizobium waimense TaxID=1300307 RepID=A0A3A5L5S9_9HYPH|nr:HAD family hydrolase [Mesorhizobium waimense]
MDQIGPAAAAVRRRTAEATAAGLKLAICSTSNERAVQAIVDVMLGPLRSRQIRVFAGDIVPAKKPDPAIYALASVELGAEPRRCLVVEDSNNGLRAALAAGMRCLVTTSSYTLDEDFPTPNAWCRNSVTEMRSRCDFGRATGLRRVGGDRGLSMIGCVSDGGGVSALQSPAISSANPFARNRVARRLSAEGSLTAT